MLEFCPAVISGQTVFLFKVIGLGSGCAFLVNVWDLTGTFHLEMH